jgi:hypothetical protein
MLNAFRLIPALQVVFAHEIEFTPESFAPLTDAQRQAYARREGMATEAIYRVVPLEPQAIEQSPEKITWELSIVTASERQLLLDAVDFVHRASASMNEAKPNFAQRLEYLRPRLPPVVTTE